jgi:hypothetical protein
MFTYRIMPLPREEDFPDGTVFYIKEFDVPLAMVPEGGSVTWYNWFGGVPKTYDVSNLKQGNNWEAESFSEWKQLIAESVSNKPEYRIRQKYIAPSYWILFIIFPSLVAGITTVRYSISKWALAAVIIFLLVIGERGLRWWASYLKQ